MILGIDIGGTTTHAVVLDERAQLLASVVRPTAHGADGVVATVGSVVAEVRAAAATAQAPSSVGVGVPGLVGDDGVVTHAVNLGIRTMPLRAELERVLGLAVTVENDVKASAVGAVARLDAWESSVTLMNFGTGVASATVIGGRLLRGVGNAAGEIGHVPLDPLGEPCGCGQRGCLELVAGGAAIQRELSALASPLTLGDLFEQSSGAGRPLEPDAAALRQRIVSAVAGAVVTAVITYGSRYVVVGGGVISHAPTLLERVRTDLARRSVSSGFLRQLDVVGRLTTLGDDWPVAAGGAALVGRPRGAAAGPAPVTWQVPVR